MSKIKALITMLVIGASSTAMASPSVTFSGRAQASWGTSWSNYREPVRAPIRAPMIRDHRYNTNTAYYQDGWRQNDRFDRYERDWMMLGTVTEVVTLGNPMEFHVGRRAGTFDTLLLQSNGGKSRIFDVTIHYNNGRTQFVKLDRYVGQQGTVAIPSSPSFMIDLDDRARVSKVVINGLNASNSSMSVLLK